MTGGGSEPLHQRTPLPLPVTGFMPPSLIDRGLFWASHLGPEAVALKEQGLELVVLFDDG